MLNSHKTAKNTSKTTNSARNLHSKQQACLPINSSNDISWETKLDETQSNQQVKNNTYAFFREQQNINDLCADSSDLKVQLAQLANLLDSNSSWIYNHLGSQMADQAQFYLSVWGQLKPKEDLSLQKTLKVSHLKTFINSNIGMSQQTNIRQPLRCVSQSINIEVKNSSNLKRATTNQQKSLQSPLDSIKQLTQESFAHLSYEGICHRIEKERALIRQYQEAIDIMSQLLKEETSQRNLIKQKLQQKGPRSTKNIIPEQINKSQDQPLYPKQLKGRKYRDQGKV